MIKTFEEARLLIRDLKICTLFESAKTDLPSLWEHVDCTKDTLRVDLLDGRSISAPLAWYPRLLHATPQQRANWQRAGGGYGIHWPEIDEDLSVEGLLRGLPAPRREPASAVQVA